MNLRIALEENKMKATGHVQINTFLIGRVRRMSFLPTVVTESTEGFNVNVFNNHWYTLCRLTFGAPFLSVWFDKKHKMTTKKVFLFPTLLFFSFFSFAQKLKKADKVILSNIQHHIAYLADDKLEGRRAGSKGEKLASDYISTQFQKIGLQPMGDHKSWLQAFGIYDGKQVNRNTHLIINGHDLKLGTEYFPFAFSANKSSEAAAAMALSETGVPWFMDLKELIEENKENPHFDLLETIKNKANAAALKGATALIIYNTSSHNDSLEFNGKDRSEVLNIPVLYITKQVIAKYLQDESATNDLKLKVDLGDKKRTANNVVGYIDNKSPTTVVLGAHYDHLGYGEDGNSRSIEKSIHNGADDNASGTASLIELARLLKQSKNKKHNYLFIAFSGEELGLYGSKYFTENPTVDFSKVNYMINMDMIGRLNENNRVLTVGGYGTSPYWSKAFNSISDNRYFKIKYDSSGTGPSDHTSFYRRNIPVLFFFTGLHSDYHKPSDDADKINYLGQLSIVKYIFNLIEATNSTGKIAFTKTREQQMSTSTRFSVSLGIMPDYSYGGSGVRVDGVSEGRPAQKAGLKTGDVIVQLNDYDTSSIEAYMQALSKFKKGDKAKVKYKRVNDTFEAEVQF